MSSQRPSPVSARSGGGSGSGSSANSGSVMATLASLLTAGRRAARLRKILAVSWRYGLDELLVEGATSTVGSQWILTALQRLSAGPRQARLDTIPRVRGCEWPSKRWVRSL